MSVEAPEGPGKRGRPVRFVLVGAWNTLFGWLSYVGCLAVADRIGVSYLVATIPAQFIAIVNAFVMQRYLVFGAKTGLLASFFRFSLVYWVFWMINTPLLALLVSGAKLDPRVASAILTAGNALLSYVAHDRFTFRVRGESE